MSNSGFLMELLEYRKSTDCTVLFVESGEIAEGVNYDKFIRGNVAHPGKNVSRHDSINELCLAFYLESYGFQKKKIYEEPIKGLEIDLYSQLPRP